MVVKFNYGSFLSVIFNAVEISKPVLKCNKKSFSKVLIIFINLYFYKTILAA